jgi:hypothetical protein
VNGSSVSTTSGSTHSRYWLASTTLSPTVYVVVSDGNGGSTTSNTIYMTISPAASFRVANNSGVSIYYIYTSTNSGSSWSSDYLGSYTLPTGYTYRVTGLSDSDTYRIRAYDDSSNYWDSGSTGTDVSMLDGYYRIFTVNAATWAMSNYSNSYASMTAPRAFALSGATGAKQASVVALAPKAADAAAFNPQIGPISAEESDPNHDPALGFGVQF